MKDQNLISQLKLSKMFGHSTQNTNCYNKRKDSGKAVYVKLHFILKLCIVNVDKSITTRTFGKSNYEAYEKNV
jgi:hypothetical protein